MAYQVTWYKKRLYIYFWGDFTVEDYIQVTSEIYGDSRIDDIQSIIRDLSEIEFFDVKTSANLFFAVALDKGASHYLQTLKVALVANKKQTRKLCQDYIDLSHRWRSRWNFQIFSSLGEAKRWVEADD